jgi:hypothetical protein
MGFWDQNEKGASFTKAFDGTDMIWGDGPADIVEEMLPRIVREFEEGVGRKPSKAEIIAGIMFSIADGDLPDHAPLREKKSEGQK